MTAAAEVAAVEVLVPINYLNDMMRERDGDRPFVPRELLDVSDVTAASTSRGSRSDKKRSSASKGCGGGGSEEGPGIIKGGGSVKKGRGLSKPLRIPRKSKAKSDSDDADDDGFSFGRMMSIMIHDDAKLPG
jgi:hypothetical protein